MDLWAFDDLEPDENDSSLPPSRAAESVVPTPRDMGARRQPAKPVTPPEDTEIDAMPIPKVVAAKESIRVNVNKSRPKPNLPGPAHSNAGSDFDDLDSWEDEEPEKEVPALRVIDTPIPKEIPEPADETMAPVEPEDVEVEPAGELDSSREEPTKKEISETVPVKKAEEKRPVASPAKGPGLNLNLSGLEKLGLVILLALLVVGGGVAYFMTVNRLKKEDHLVRANDFPISGKNVKIQSADSFWRAPVVEGPNADTVRRGTQLLPVLELAVEGGPAELRILFRNAKGDLVGDAVTRQSGTGGKVEAAATAGFDDLGMYAAYRTGTEKPWTVEVHEVSSGDSQAKTTKLFQIQIATDSR